MRQILKMTIIGYLNFGKEPFKSKFLSMVEFIICYLAIQNILYLISLFSNFFWIRLVQQRGGGGRCVWFDEGRDLMLIEENNTFIFYTAIIFNITL
jgi:hypothetical protein